MFAHQENKWFFNPRDEGSMTGGGINNGTSGNKEGQVDYPVIEEHFIPHNQAVTVGNWFSPGIILPHCGCPLSNPYYCYQEPEQQIPEHLIKPTPRRGANSANRNPSCLRMAERMGMRYKDTLDEDGKGPFLSLDISHKNEEPSLTLTLGRDSFGKGKQFMGYAQSGDAPLRTQHSLLDGGEDGKYLSLRTPVIEDRRKLTMRLPREERVRTVNAPEANLPNPCWNASCRKGCMVPIGRVYGNGSGSGNLVLTNYAHVNQDARFKYMPVSCGHEQCNLVPMVPVNPPVSRAYGKGTENIIRSSNQFVNHGNGFKLMGVPINSEQDTPVRAAPKKQPVGQAYGKGSGNLFPATYSSANQGNVLKLVPAPVDNDQNNLVAAPVYNMGKVFMVSMNAGGAYNMVDDNAVASASTGKKDYSKLNNEQVSLVQMDPVNGGKGILISEDTAEAVDSVETLVVTPTGIEEEPQSEVAPIHNNETEVMPSTNAGRAYDNNAVTSSSIDKKGDGILVPENTAQAYDEIEIMAITPTGMEEKPQSEASGTQEPGEASNLTNTVEVAEASAHGAVKAYKRKCEEGSTPDGKKRRKAKQKLPPDTFPQDVKSLMSTGVFDGVPVKYATWTRDKILRGVIAGSKILCGCPNCNNTRPVNALEFERHAGGNTKHPSNHIHFPNGKTVYEVVHVLQKAPSESLFQLMQTVSGYPVNQERFEAWKASYQASSLRNSWALGAAEEANKMAN